MSKCTFAVVMLSLISLVYSSLTSCNENTILSSDSAYKYVVENFGANNSLNGVELYSFIKKSGLFHSYSKTPNCSGLSYVGNLSKSDILVNSTTFSHICTNSLVMLIKDSYQCKRSLDEIPSSKSLFDKPNESEKWGFGLLAVTIISLCSLVGISLLPLMKSECYDKVLLYLIALAVGTLSSNAIFHLIPKSFQVPVDLDPLRFWRSAVVFSGFYIFYLVENILERIFNVSHVHANLGPSPETDSTIKLVCVDKAKKMQPLCNDAETLKSNEVLLKPSADIDVVNTSESENSSQTCMKSDFVVDDQQKQCWIFKNFRSIKTVAWLITVADGIHNFIDGLAIGASFSTSLVHGLSTSLALFCEEFPHELGDFAILVSSGMTIKQAAFYNFASACCCYLGLITGILLGNDFAAAQWIFAFAGGVFLYISLAGMLPEAQAHCTKRSLKHSPWLCFFLKNAGLLSGFAIMLLLTVFEDEISIS